MAASKPGMNFNLTYENDLIIFIPYLGENGFRGILKLICINAEMEMLEGRRDNAWDAILTGLKMNSHLKTEPQVISQMIYYRNNNLSLTFISDNLLHYGISDEQAAKFILELGSDRTIYSQSMKKAFDSQRICISNGIFERVLSGELTSSNFGELLNAIDVNPFICQAP